jgi:hypothetical protein
MSLAAFSRKNAVQFVMLQVAFAASDAGTV